MLVLIGSVFFEPGENVSDLGDEVARTAGDAVRGLPNPTARGQVSIRPQNFQWWRGKPRWKLLRAG